MNVYNAYRDVCPTSVHGLYISGTLYARCQHCGSNSRAISSRMDGSAFYTFCEQCHEHSIWLAPDKKPKPQNIVKHVEPQKWYHKLFKLFKGR